MNASAIDLMKYFGFLILSLVFEMDPTLFQNASDFGATFSVTCYITFRIQAFNSLSFAQNQDMINEQL